MVDRYNTFMNGVDKSDQLLSYYSFNYRTVKWYIQMSNLPLDRLSYCECLHPVSNVYSNRKEYEPCPVLNKASNKNAHQSWY